MISGKLPVLALGSLLLALGMMYSRAEAATYSSKAIIENAKLLDGKKVTYRAEAVISIMNRGDHAWLNANDGANAIGIWCSRSMLEPVRFLGDYKFKGDIVEVEGMLNRACPVHGGELDIHARKLKVVKSGYPVKERAGSWKMFPAGVLFVLTLVITVVFRKRI